MIFFMTPTWALEVIATMTSEVMFARLPADYPPSVRHETTSGSSTFGASLRRHRNAHGMSQERLAEAAEISTRHLSFLETGKATPSRTMVLVLGSALDLPLRERNQLLNLAGFAPAYRDEPLDAPDAVALRRAVDLVLDAVQPNGAIAWDRAANILRMNDAATRLLAAFIDIAAAPPEVLRNAVVATLHPLGLRPAIVNFDEVARLLLERAHRESSRYPDDPAMAEVRAAIDAIPDLPRRFPSAPSVAAPFLTVHLRRGDLEARIFTTIATIGTPIDATAEEIRIETYFPADDATSRLMRTLAVGS
jgi:transcriptional regulator with XRE-family HTH domain